MGRKPANKIAEDSSTRSEIGLQDRFDLLMETAEQATVNANASTKTELISCVQSIYSQLIQFAAVINPGYLEKGVQKPASEIVVTMRRMLANELVSDLLKQGWYLETNNRELTRKDGSIRTATYWRMRRWTRGEDGRRRREYKYIGVSYMEG